MSEMYDSTVFDMPRILYEDAMNHVRREFENRLKQIKNEKDHKDALAECMKKSSKEVSFETDINDNEDKRYAFAEMLRILHRKNTDKRIVIKTTAFDRTTKHFTISNKQNLETTIGCIIQKLI